MSHTIRIYISYYYRKIFTYIKRYLNKHNNLTVSIYIMTIKNNAYFYFYQGFNF